jgi:hypothetical protein
MSAAALQLKKSLADAIKHQMKFDHLSISSFARKTKTNRHSVRRILDGKNTSITLKTMAKAERFCSCHTLAKYASFRAVPFIYMHAPTVGQKSRNPVIFAVYEGQTNRRPTSERSDWQGFESLQSQPDRGHSGRFAASNHNAPDSLIEGRPCLGLLSRAAPGGSDA